MNRQERIAQLEKASEERWTLIAERDAAQAELRAQVEATAGLRAQLEGLQAVQKAKDRERGELAQLVGVLYETAGQLKARVN